jgi:hypothetical protein
LNVNRIIGQANFLNLATHGFGLLINRNQSGFEAEPGRHT